MHDYGNPCDILTRSAIEMIEAVAASKPDAIALRASGSQMTYRGLMSRANRLAEELTDAGVACEVPVGICLDRSFEYIVTMLATSKAGGAFLPLDPAWPEKRLQFALEEARVPVIVTSPARFAQFIQAGRIVLSADMKPESRSHRSSRPCAPVLPDNLAYIIYTSGSTGGPKGVEITHGNLLALIAWHHEAFAVTAQDRASFVAGLGFDAAVWEIWPYLCAGACLSLADEAERTSWEALRRWLIAERITMAFVPTPLAEPMIATEWPSDTALRFLLTGGDTLHTRPAAGLPFFVVNNYGPTECTVVASSGLVEPACVKAGLPSIGRAIAGAQIHILNEHRTPVDVGEVGEIYIGGSGAGRGYRHRPELTAERFIADPFAQGSTARLYRTGDLAQWLPDGQIAFRGRCDSQVKVHGHRVELDEISAVLNSHPFIEQCAVVARGEGSETALIAYIVPKPGTCPRAGELRGHLASQLPNFMLPAVFVSVSSLPVSTSGKPDHKSLPEPSALNTLSSAEYREPSSPIEEKLVSIVAELLKLDRVGVEDNFFLLGGHSLLGTQLVLRARDAFGSELTLRDLFQAQTVARLAATIEKRIVERLTAMSDEEAGRLLAS